MPPSVASMRSIRPLRLLVPNSLNWITSAATVLASRTSRSPAFNWQSRVVTVTRKAPCVAAAASAILPCALSWVHSPGPG